MTKQKDHAFGKDVYLLGKDSDGILYWLEQPKWDCGWYWGFGYIETYQNNRLPSKASDIESHSHADNFMRDYFTEWNGSTPILAETTFSEKEGWELSELFKRFYTLRECAGMFGRGGCHVSGTSDYLKDEKLAKRINEELIPKVTARIIEILTPKQA